MEFINLKEEVWNNEMAKYKGSCPSANCNYEDRLVNLYRGYDEDESIDIIKSEIADIVDSIKDSVYFADKKLIEAVQFDIDDSCNLGFVDIILSVETSENDFKAFLKWLNNTF